MTTREPLPPIVLSLSGHDPTGGAGIQADIEAIGATGCRASTVITALTVQDTSNVYAVQPQSPAAFLAQGRALIRDLPVAAVKIGLLGSAEIARSVAALLEGMESLATARAPEPARPVAAADGRRYRIRQGDTLGAIAARLGTSVAELRRMNGLSGNAIRAGHQLRVPGADAPPARTASTGFASGKRAGSSGARLHTVSRGDTLWHVSRRYQVSIDEIAAMNGLPRTSVLSPGQKLVVGKAAGKQVDTTATPARVAAAGGHYQVRSGDSLWSIARRFGVTVDDLCRWNDIDRRARLATGQTLIVSAGDVGA